MDMNHIYDWVFDLHPSLEDIFVSTSMLKPESNPIHTSTTTNTNNCNSSNAMTVLTTQQQQPLRNLPMIRQNIQIPNHHIHPNDKNNNNNNNDNDPSPNNDNTTTTTLIPCIKYFYAQFNLHRTSYPITSPYHLSYQILQYPIYCLCIQIWIHIQAFHLFWKGVEFIPHPNGSHSETIASKCIGWMMIPFFKGKDYYDWFCRRCHRRGDDNDVDKDGDERNKKIM
jgi:hypothetical protein